MMSENNTTGEQIMSTDIDGVNIITSMSPKSGLESPLKVSSNAKSDDLASSDDEYGSSIFKTKRRVQRFSDSDSDVPIEHGASNGVESGSEQNSDEESTKVFGSSKSRIRKIAVSGDDDSDIESRLSPKASDFEGSNHVNKSKNLARNGIGKSRIQKITSEDDDSDNSSHKEPVATKNEEQQLRMTNKKNKLKDKFKNLLNSRAKETEGEKKESDGESGKDDSANEESDGSNEDMSSITKIKQILKSANKSGSGSLKMSICDPDTSDEDNNQVKKPYKPKKDQKRTKLTSPKPQRMSAKQAMENMQKIKSESNRMLREREVSLPYHRPKALSLQDIMKRRRPAVSSDGKALPIKMNEDQLKQYALMLEERQKEMMELCKSESEEDDIDNKKDLEDEANKSALITTETNNEKSDNLSDVTDLTKETTVQLASEIDNFVNKELGLSYSENNEISTENSSNKALIDIKTTINDKSRVEDDLQNNSGDMSAEMQLVYNDSIEENVTSNEIPKDNILATVNAINCENIAPDTTLVDKQNLDTANDDVIPNNNDIPIDDDEEDVGLDENNSKSSKTTHNSEIESQLISLRYDSENTDTIKVISVNEQDVVSKDVLNNKTREDTMNDSVEEFENDDFPDDEMDMNDINMDDIDSIIEKAEIVKDTKSGALDSPALVRDIPVLNVKPKLTGAPGMVIDLDGTDPIAPKKLTGVELLKERFTFFAKLKTPEEMERERERRQKPGTQHLKLKQELEDKIAEQRSLEWSKRLENEKQQQMELDAVRGDASDAEDDIDKIEAKLNEDDVEKESSSENEEEELLEDDVLIEDKPKKKNPLVADEAEESDVDDTAQDDNNDNDDNEELNDDDVEGDDEADGKSEEDSSEEESSESEDEVETKPKKGRILKAFEDSDDEEATKLEEKDLSLRKKIESDNAVTTDELLPSQTYGIIDSQDDVIQLAQIPKQMSSDVFTSQGSAQNSAQQIPNSTISDNSKEEEDLGTQTFSILDASKTVKDIDDPDKLTVVTADSDKLNLISNDLDKLTETQPFSDNLDAVLGMCSGNFQTQNCIEIQPPSQSQMSQSQTIGEDILDMCTGKFYDNQFVSPNEDKLNTSDDLSQDATPTATLDEENKNKLEAAPIIEVKEKEKRNQEGDILKSVLDELNEPNFESAKPLKFFFDGKKQNKENEPIVTNAQIKKRLIIDSDDETNDNGEANNQKKKKKFKKKKLEKRALQISDDEEEEQEDFVEEDDYLSGDENEDGVKNDEERLVEYDSEENEVEIKPQNVKKKKRKGTEFFEQEAELTSEDEWVGSGDEDEAGLDRMEREEGDDDTFHQGQLQRELGQIHMRDVLDQDKREVRLIQELLFEDGDLGGGGRQRKFRWRNADGEEETGTVPDELADTQEEEFESEEQWRKQRHEREMFLRQMKNEENDELNVSVNRNSIIKANLCSRTMSSLLEEANQSAEAPAPAVPEKKPKDIPSPVKKPFAMFQQNYHGSLLTRGQGALARLAALATPLAVDDDAPKIGRLAPTSARNFVFAALTPEVEPKVTKRKAESNAGTPRLVKKMKTEEKQNRSKSSLLEFLKT